MTDLGEHFFRHAYARLVATLTRRVGVAHLAEVEDAVQNALMTAVDRWKGGTPEQPEAWLYRVAHNTLMGALRTRTNRQRILGRDPSAGPSPVALPSAVLTGEIDDDLLRMLFVCCDPAIPVPSQLALALKTLCGFGVGEIAERLFTTQANVYKRLTRARDRLRQAPPQLELDPSAVPERLVAVRSVLYLLFTEGHLSVRADATIRRELCDEAIRLAELVARHPLGAEPETAALVALMHLHRARLDARESGSGTLVLLEEQARERWDLGHIETGMRWLERSARGEHFSRFHAEARIAAAHCLSPSIEATPWPDIADTYALLERLSPSPLHRLNRAVAVAQWKGPHAGLAVLEDMVPPTWLDGSYQWSAVLADLHRRAGDPAQAARHRASALDGAPSAAVRQLLERRLSPADG